MTEIKNCPFSGEKPDDYIKANSGRSQTKFILEIRTQEKEHRMILEEAKLKKLIAEHEKKAEEAYMNYQSTGYSRYETAQQKHEDWVDTLKAVLYSASNARVARMLKTNVRAWATTIENLKDKTDEEKQEEIEKLLEEIAATKKLLKYM